MDITNMGRNILNPDCEVVWFYNISCRFTVLVDVSWVIGDLESKVL